MSVKYKASKYSNKKNLGNSIKELGGILYSE
jgi:hypothetical protein